jgi:aspartate kinase
MKVGGGCFTDRYALPQVLKLIEREMSGGSKVIAVISAMGNTTNDLLDQAEVMMYGKPKPQASVDSQLTLSEKLDPRTMDMLLSTGETKSAALVTNHLIGGRIRARCFTGGQAGIVTDDKFGDANIIEVKTANLLKCFNDGIDVAVVAGFQGQTKDGDITTLGRNGSDTTAFYLTEAFNVKLCTLYKPVNGIYTGDPKIMENFKRGPGIRHYKYLNFHEVLNKNVSGIIHDKALRLCEKMFSENKDLEIVVRNFDWPDRLCTTICNKQTEFYR